MLPAMVEGGIFTKEGCVTVTGMCFFSGVVVNCAVADMCRCQLSILHDKGKPAGAYFARFL